jgi:hypothetical protein
VSILVDTETFEKELAKRDSKIFQLQIDNNALRTQLAEATRKLEEARKDVVREVIVILDGIDMAETDSEKGWWETSAGAEFGKNKLAQIQAIEQGKGEDES